MDLYREILQSRFETILITPLIFGLIYLAISTVALLLRKKFNTRKIIIIMAALFIVDCLKASLLLIPMAIDLKEDSFVVIEDGSLEIGRTFSTFPGDSTNDVYGYAYAHTSDRSQGFELCGVDFFEFESPEAGQTFYGNIVYAEHSKLLILIEYDPDDTSPKMYPVEFGAVP